jgi:hypothetical protein
LWAENRDEVLELTASETCGSVHCGGRFCEEYVRVNTSYSSKGSTAFTSTTRFPHYE